MTWIKCPACFKKAFFVDVDGKARCVNCTPYKEK